VSTRIEVGNGWHWSGDAWYCDEADGYGPPAREAPRPDVVLLFAPVDQSRIEAILRACRSVRGIGYVARDGGARVGVSMSGAIGLLRILGTGLVPARITVSAGPDFSPEDAERIRMAAGSRTIIEVIEVIES
jgi:hypothetical protein